MSSKEVQRWADDFMFEAEEINEDTGPEVYLLAGNPDPLGSIAAAAKAYMGEFVGSLSEVTDAERRHYLTEIQKTALAMPLEAVQFHFRIKGVTRGFTHQMVRQRTAAYSQESTRFAVKSGVPVGRPPSIDGTLSRKEWRENEAKTTSMSSASEDVWLEYEERYAKENQKWRFMWDEAVEAVAKAYNKLVDAGMPAEDARGILPTNLLTQLNYITNLRNLQVEGGKRLCTQAQFEWRIVWSKMIEAMRDFGQGQTYTWAEPWDEDGTHIVDRSDGPYTVEHKKGEFKAYHVVSSAWQYEELAKIFKPVCYLEGSCPFNASFDRKCSIRSRVEANDAINRPSTEWHKPVDGNHTAPLPGEGNRVFITEGPSIPAIHPAEWLLDPKAAR
ncbi:ThyX-like thymidylate synthase [Gordonia phage Fulcrum]|uniref:ThyX-like thymidylate synthase n=1 Tax=Gordonia phage Fulcrum TaxID=3077818 RepID=A0AA96R256_9CAUD|nr:ThyX-like thymidylate synthase [Gordonia phage GOATification]WNO27193.1 ThyX-like thymidylate synthase [Gordonia phage Fulcrum]